MKRLLFILILASPAMLMYSESLSEQDAPRKLLEGETVLIKDGEVSDYHNQWDFVIPREYGKKSDVTLTLHIETTPYGVSSRALIQYDWNMMVYSLDCPDGERKELLEAIENCRLSITADLSGSDGQRISWLFVAE